MFFNPILKGVGDVFVTMAKMLKRLEKHMFVSHTKHMQRKIKGSTSFAIDNMFYVNFRI